jgi:hypothetical protein
VKAETIAEVLGNDLVTIFEGAALCPNKRRVRATFQRYQDNVVELMKYLGRLEAGEVPEQELEDLKNLIEGICKIAQLEIASHGDGAWHRSNDWYALYGLCTDTLD